MNRNEAVYWALAREHAPQVLASSENRPQSLAITDIEGNPASLITKMAGRTAIISIAGALDKETYISAFTGKIWRLGHDLIRLALESALLNPKVKAILLSIDSPGGVVQGTKELADLISEIALVKPMAAYADGLCASAAYWLASATGRIVAPATALVGSIGVIMRIENWAGFYAKAGLQIEYVASGKYKAAGQDGRELTEEERAYFAGQLNELHAIFREDVRNALAIKAEDALWAEAQLMPASQAVSLGLVSKIVRDEKEALKQLSPQEGKMDLKELKAEQPELVSQIEAEFAAASRQKEALAKEETQKEMLALVKALGNEELAAKMEAVLASGVTASQFAALSPLFASAANSSEKSAEEKILAGLENQGAPITTGNVPQNRVNPLLADAARRHKEAL